MTGPLHPYGPRGDVPAAAGLHAECQRLPIPAACPHCHAAPTAFHDDGRGTLDCLLCGWTLLYQRPSHALAALPGPPPPGPPRWRRRRRGRGHGP